MTRALAALLLASLSASCQTWCRPDPAPGGRLSTAPEAQEARLAVDFDFPFVSFVDATGTIPGITGPADLTDVGAIQLIIGPGPTSGVDLQLDLLTTAADAPAELTTFSIE